MLIYCYKTRARVLREAIWSNILPRIKRLVNEECIYYNPLDECISLGTPEGLKILCKSRHFKKYMTYEVLECFLFVSAFKIDMLNILWPHMIQYFSKYDWYSYTSTLFNHLIRNINGCRGPITYTYMKKMIDMCPIERGPDIIHYINYLLETQGVTNLNRFSYRLIYTYVNNRKGEKNGETDSVRDILKSYKCI